MRTIDVSDLQGRPRPTPRVLQFGEGNFLRAFVDWKIDRMNEAGLEDWGVIVIRPIPGGNPKSLNEQDGLYTVLSRGMDEAGRKISESRVIASVRREIAAHGQWSEVLAAVRDLNIQVIVSNTTDAGIAYVPTVKYDDDPPVSFPGKMTRLLHERWKAFDGEAVAGLSMIACELIDHNGDALRRIVLRHAEEWALEAAFIAWLKTANSFHNTLVDRIVPGYPRADIDQVRAELGYDDAFIATAELFHLFVIERRQDQKKIPLPLARHDPETIIAEDVSPYKERKVAILNGAHTALCPLALIAGVETVGEAVTTEVGSKFLDRLLNEEVIPFLSLPKAELEAFAASVRARFANPFIRHLWYDIALNSIAKYQARNLPRLEASLERTGKPSPLMTLSLAAWLVFYLGRHAHAETWPPRDSAEIIARAVAIGEAGDAEAVVAAWLSEASFWGRSIDTPVLRAAVLEAYRFITAGPFTFERLATRLG
ncbi:Altronate oxidoreductase [Rhodovastum atsumiense]|uniref:Tagaturonate reductase n=2 Tax=Rhodovastum atsumiense TaxID=504468 RepID=A0A5M6ILN9_9PROT|nr:tagaturonate reductase [Rhodovastum atsumiense]KAA5609164.1 tagaturonate reductase [Rhodovastum atsumiense]CAH2601242.1 Altronate oxidoreductase [Rhodovastum atsumiense]